MAAPSLAGLKARLDGAGSHLGWGKGSLPMAGGGTGWSVRSLPTPTIPSFCDSKTDNYLNVWPCRNLLTLTGEETWAVLYSRCPADSFLSPRRRCCPSAQRCSGLGRRAAWEGDPRSGAAVLPGEHPSVLGDVPALMWKTTVESCF